MLERLLCWTYVSVCLRFCKAACVTNCICPEGRCGFCYLIGSNQFSSRSGIFRYGWNMGERVIVVEVWEMAEENWEGSKRLEAALIMGKLGRSLSETVGSVINILLKLVVYLAYIAIQGILPTGRREWIKVSIFISVIADVVPFRPVSRNENSWSLEKTRGHAAHTLTISPFFAWKYTVEPLATAPSRQFAEAILSAGIHCANLVRAGTSRTCQWSGFD